MPSTPSNHRLHLSKAKCCGPLILTAPLSIPTCKAKILCKGGGWASQLAKQNFSAAEFQKMWNWILIIGNLPSSLSRKKQTDICSVPEHREHTNYKLLSGTEHCSLSLDRLSARRTGANQAAVIPEAMWATTEASGGSRLCLSPASERIAWHCFSITVPPSSSRPDCQGQISAVGLHAESCAFYSLTLPHDSLLSCFSPEFIHLSRLISKSTSLIH